MMITLMLMLMLLMMMMMTTIMMIMMMMIVMMMTDAKPCIVCIKRGVKGNVKYKNIYIYILLFCLTGATFHWPHL